MRKIGRVVDGASYLVFRSDYLSVDGFRGIHVIADLSNITFVH